VLAPIGGVIMEVNQTVRETPAAANREPYGEGWLFLIHTPDIKASIKPLMNVESAVGWMQSEAGQLEHLIEEVAGPLAADGGYFTDGIFDHLPGLGWERLTKMFLRT
jgi:hypothetical protein